MTSSSSPLEQLSEHALVCLTAFKNSLSGQDPGAVTPGFCKMVEVGGVPDLTGTVTITVTLSATSSSAIVQHRFDE